MQLFANGFESGDLSAWTESLASGTGTSVAASASAARDGSYGLRAVHDYTVADQNYEAKAGIVFDPPLTSRLFVEADIRLTNVASVGYGAAGSKAVMLISGTTGQDLIVLTLRSGGLRLAYRSRSSSLVTLNSNIPVATNTWVRFRLLLDRTGPTPYIEGWRSDDGGGSWTSLGSGFDNTSGVAGVARAPARLDVGVVHVANFEKGSYTIDVDGVEIRDSEGAVTDWRLYSNLAEAVDFRTNVAISYPIATDIRSSVSIAAEAQKTAEASGDLVVDAASISEASQESTALSETDVVFEMETEATIARETTSNAAFDVVLDTLLVADHAQESETRFGPLQLRTYAVQGEILPAVRVAATDVAWGAVAGEDSDGSA